jgi:hypothetical protein
MRNDKGESCLASGSVDGRVRFGSSACGRGDVRTSLPSADDPIYTDVAGVLRPPRVFEVIAVVGLAATGVAEVALVGTGDDVVDSAPVTGNVFQLRPSPSSRWVRSTRSWRTTRTETRSTGNPSAVASRLRATMKAGLTPVSGMSHAPEESSTQSSESEELGEEVRP